MPGFWIHDLDFGDPYEPAGLQPDSEKDRNGISGYRPAFAGGSAEFGIRFIERYHNIIFFVHGSGSL